MGGGLAVIRSEKVDADQPEVRAVTFAMEELDGS
jgi:hypothetical protein